MRRALSTSRCIHHAARRAVLLAVCLLASAGCSLGEQEAVALRRFPYPYRAGLAAVSPTWRSVEPGPAGAASPLRLFGGRICARPGPVVHTIGQDGPCSLIDRAKQFMACVRGYFTTGLWPSDVYFGNTLLLARPGHYACLLFAPPFSDVPGVRPASIDDILSERVLLELEAKSGYMLLSSGGVAADPDAVARRVAASGRQERILVERPDALVRRRVVESSLNWSSTVSPDSVIIRIESIDDPVGGSFVPSVLDLAGVTFYTPMPGSTAVSIDGTRVPGLVSNPPDHSHRRSVSIAPQPSR
jgi:hypothetical protein